MELDITIENGSMVRVRLLDEFGNTVIEKAVSGDAEGQAQIDAWRTEGLVSDPPPMPEEEN